MGELSKLLLASAPTAFDVALLNGDEPQVQWLIDTEEAAQEEVW